MKLPPRCQDRDSLLDILMSQTIGPGDTGPFLDLLELEFGGGERRGSGNSYPRRPIRGGSAHEQH